MAVAPYDRSVTNDLDQETIALRRHAVGRREDHAPGASESSLHAVGTVPRCDVHADAIAYIACRECGRPACAVCREVSAVGQLCAECARRERDTDGIAVSPRMARGAMLVAMVTAVLGAATVLSPVLAREFAFAPFTLTSSPWRIVTGLFVIPGFGYVALVLVIVPLWFAASGHEHRRGTLSMLVVLALGGIAGFTLLFAVTGSSDPTWTLASGTLAAGIAALAVSACWPHPRHVGWRPWFGAGIALTGVLSMTLLGVIPAWQVVGGLVMGCLLEAVYAFSPKPQRHPLPLFIGLGAGVLVVVLTLVAVLFLRG